MNSTDEIKKQLEEIKKILSKKDNTFMRTILTLLLGSLISIASTIILKNYENDLDFKMLKKKDFYIVNKDFYFETILISRNLNDQFEKICRLQIEKDDTAYYNKFYGYKIQLFDILDKYKYLIPSEVINSGKDYNKFIIDKFIILESDSTKRNDSLFKSESLDSSKIYYANFIIELNKFFKDK